ncbi:MAG: hypothetical protein LBT05_07255 [Planctomycetaceae bacterium]|jgi:hypothetical protein|nr:hypothetical protein [Planctomycetaceae bacterium]
MNTSSIFSVFICLCYFLLFSFSALAQDQKSIWNKQIQFSSNGAPFRETLTQFAESHHIGFLLDRKVDPEIPLIIDIPQATVSDVFAQIAEKYHFGFCEFETTAYIGPEESADFLRILAALRKQQFSKLPQEKSGVFLNPISFHTELMDSPEVTLKRLCDKIGLNGTAFEKLPYDQLPEMNFYQESPHTILALLLIGFDNMYLISKGGGKLAPAPIPKDQIMTREYTGDFYKRLQENDLQTFIQNIENVQIEEIQEEKSSAKNKKTVSGIRVKASLRELAKIERQVQKVVGESQKTLLKASEDLTQTLDNNDFANDAALRLKNKLFTAKVNAGLEKALQEYAKQMQLNLTIDEKSFAAKNVRLDTRISVDLQQVTYTELFEKCLAPVGGKFRITGNHITVYME